MRSVPRIAGTKPFRSHCLAEVSKTVIEAEGPVGRVGVTAEGAKFAPSTVGPVVADRKAMVEQGTAGSMDERDQCSPLAAATEQAGCDDPDAHPSLRQDTGTAVEVVSSRKEKRPYTKPTYRYERVFETMALSCGKIDPTQFLCHFHRKNS